MAEKMRKMEIEMAAIGTCPRRPPVRERKERCRLPADLVLPLFVLLFLEAESAALAALSLPVD